jgi:hypothetical protein
VPFPIADVPPVGIVAAMTGKADTTDRVAAIVYTFRADGAGLTVFALFALSPIPPDLANGGEHRTKRLIAVVTLLAARPWLTANIGVSGPHHLVP